MLCPFCSREMGRFHRMVNFDLHQTDGYLYLVCKDREHNCTICIDPESPAVIQKIAMTIKDHSHCQMNLEYGDWNSSIRYCIDLYRSRFTSEVRWEEAGF